MALRKGVAYRNYERPWTRKSRKRSKSYIKTIPPKKIVKFQMGNTKRKFPLKLSLVTKDRIQLRDNSIEAARMTINRHLEDNLGINNYHFFIRVYPHQILREHKMLTGAGADRLQSGMKLAFGKPVGAAARINVGDEIFAISIDEGGLVIAKEAFRRIKAKLPCSTSVLIVKIGG